MWLDDPTYAAQPQSSWGASGLAMLCMLSASEPVVWSGRSAVTAMRRQQAFESANLLMALANDIDEGRPTLETQEGEATTETSIPDHPLDDAIRVELPILEDSLECVEAFFEVKRERARRVTDLGIDHLTSGSSVGPPDIR